jgi:hypothetical protein
MATPRPAAVVGTVSPDKDKLFSDQSKYLEIDKLL